MNAHGRRAIGETLAALGGLLLLTLIASWPLFESGWYQSHEDVNLVKRVFALYHEIDGGTLYPRWLSLTYRGLGSPFFNFYSPGYYFASGWLHALGVPLVPAMKTVCVALFYIGGAGMYFWARRRYGHWGALLAATLYLYTPYHFFDIYVRGAMAEFSALAFMPWLFLGIDLCFEEKESSTGPALLAFGAAATLLSHHLSAFMVAPFAAIYIAWSAWNSFMRRKALMRILLGGASALGLTAFYWLPLLLEVKYLTDLRFSVTTGYSNYNNHFVRIPQLFTTWWGFGTSKPGPDDTVSFQIGLATLFFSIASLALLALPTEKHRRHMLLLPALGIVGLLLTTDLAKPLYDNLPGFAFIQFPWRYLGPSTLFLALFGGLAADSAFTGRIPATKLKPLAAAVGIVFCLLASTEQRAVKAALDVGKFDRGVLTEAEIAELQLGALCEENEYTSKWTNLPLPAELGPFINGGVPISDRAAIANSVRGHGKMTFDAASDAPETQVVLPLFFFPGWTVEIDGVETPAKPDNFGFITFILPKGRNHVTARFADTLPRSLGWAISAATLLVVGVWLVRRWKLTRLATSA